MKNILRYPMRFYSLGEQKVTTRDDAVVNDSSIFYKTRQERLVQIMKELNCFSKH
ncbi:MAG TPA: hypothetical protein VMW23_06005 [Sedimentisphaerales bacterium]|nr:hypothetical protein [Sedimentisphaerales bacterium]